MSDFSAVDASNNIDGLVAYLDATDAGLTAMKSYVAAAARRASAHDAVVLDVGCGVGHDLVRLEDGDLRAVGVDASFGMLRIARRRLDPSTRLVQAEGANLPFRDGCLEACRVERLLQHVRVVGHLRRNPTASAFVKDA